MMNTESRPFLDTAGSEVARGVGGAVDVVTRPAAVALNKLNREGGALYVMKARATQKIVSGVFGRPMQRG